MPDTAKTDDYVELRKWFIGIQTQRRQRMLAHLPSVAQVADRNPIPAIFVVPKNKHIKLADNDKLRIERELPDPKARAQMVRDVLRSLGQPKVEASTL